MIAKLILIYMSFIKGSSLVEGEYNISVIANSSEAWKMVNEGDKLNVSVAYFDFIEEGFGLKKTPNTEGKMKIFKNTEYEGTVSIDKIILMDYDFYDRPLRLIIQSEDGKVIFISRLLYRKAEIIELPDATHLQYELFIYIFYLINNFKEYSKTQYLDSELLNILRTYPSGILDKSEFFDITGYILDYVISKYPFLSEKAASLESFLNGDNEVDFNSEEWYEYRTVIKTAIGEFENNHEFFGLTSRFVKVFTNYISLVSDADILTDKLITGKFTTKRY